ncbi:MAG: tRNA 2-thiouridine(34) synthase MnmA [Clostridia bacterium]|nr:tRNA 2-thiouridine(34) synthase MnmA [Clostridia bacterium]
MNDAILIAMSGGVDSAVAAALSVEHHARAAGVTMQLEHAPSRDADDAAALCHALGIEHYTADFADLFNALVKEPFIRAYEAGLTPNPCVTCNRTVKFGALFDYAKQRGYDRLATGHYARIEKSTNGRMLLRTAACAQKDQSYVLYTLGQDVLARVELPLGGLDKDAVRAIAQEKDFPMAARKDSQDICFIPDGDYAAFIRRTRGTDFAHGKLLSSDGRVLGEHEGHIRYTIGQRKGLGFAAGHPIYVIAKDAAANTVTLGENAELFSKRLVAHSINLIPFDRMDTPMHVSAKIRYGTRTAAARVEQTGDDELTVEFEEAQRAVCPGQSVVLYKDDYVIGGGIIR